jgi:hypothetical protein
MENELYLISISNFGLVPCARLQGFVPDVQHCSDTEYGAPGVLGMLKDTLSPK